MPFATPELHNQDYMLLNSETIWSARILVKSLSNKSMAEMYHESDVEQNKNSVLEIPVYKSSKSLNILQKYKDVTEKHISDKDSSCLKLRNQRMKKTLMLHNHYIVCHQHYMFVNLRRNSSLHRLLDLYHHHGHNHRHHQYGSEEELLDHKKVLYTV
ncbi:unnamed protein product [Mytilus coruscus]|uniref:Uncharacterized protein n=1 Tax=Mytilus coruscus TaxID=42192 RepID=A0A6J8DE90_MYTCO|nr:unnamed protein product [Mytilus coruscus]